MAAEFEAEFLFFGGRPSVDFVNTELIAADERCDLIVDAAALRAWAGEAGYRLSEAPETAAWLRSARALRRALRALFEARCGGRPPEEGDLATLNRCLTRAARGPALLFEEGVFRRERSAVKPSELPRLIAEDAAALLAGPESGRLRSCANQRCILFFVDRSRTGKRRWCSMKLCGNRAKVAAHYRRKRGKAGGAAPEGGSPPGSSISGR